MDISVKTIYGDYEVPDHETDFHEYWIDQFKYGLDKLFRLQGWQVTTTPIVETEYYPEKRKFKIIRMSKGYRTAIGRTLEVNTEFTKQYIISNQDILYI